MFHALPQMSMEGATMSTGCVPEDAGRPSATRTQHAIRLLTLLAECGETTNESDPADTVKVVRSELRVQAMDFWLRNPDYLADELVTLAEAGSIDEGYLGVAQSLLDDPEPDLRWYPMPKWFYGAYEPLDDAFSLLETYRLATVRRSGRPGVKRLRSQFYLTELGAEAVDDLAADPVLKWYVAQSQLVRIVAGTDVGKNLKDRQYKQATYASTELGLSIAPIGDRVRERLNGLAVPTTDTASELLGERP
jgi:hypothetical protein